MVEANPSGSSQDVANDLEESIFDQIDEEIRNFHDECKDFVEKLSRKILYLSKKHRKIAE